MIGQVLEAEAIAARLGISRNSAGVLAAYVELIEELGTDDVSAKVIARRAGVGERTVFRHYSTREELLVGAVTWAEHSVFARPVYESIFDVPVGLRQTMLAYHARPELAHVVAEVMMRGSSGVEAASTGQLFEDLIRGEIPSLDEQELRDTAAALVHLDSAGTWVALRREFGMEAHDVADAAAWAAEAVLNPLRSRSGDPG